MLHIIIQKPFAHLAPVTVCKILIISRLPVALQRPAVHLHLPGSFPAAIQLKSGIGHSQLHAAAGAFLFFHELFQRIGDRRGKSAPFFILEQNTGILTVKRDISHPVNAGIDLFFLQRVVADHHAADIPVLTGQLTGEQNPGQKLACLVTLRPAQKLLI